MVTWILTSTAIAAFSAVVLEMFKECSSNEVTSSADALQGWTTRAHHPYLWETMSEADLDALLEEFARAADSRVGFPAPKLSY